MRATRTFILRLLVNSAEPQALRGALRAVDGSEGHMFASAAGLLEILQQASAADPPPAVLACVPQAPCAIPPTGDKEDIG